jgi:transposase-like protein
MKVKMTCPFCGKDHCVEETENGYHCTSCEYDFTEEEINTGGLN